MKKSLFWRNVRYLALKQCAINILILMRCEIRAAQIKGKKNKQTNQQNTMLIKLSSKSFFLSAILHSADVCSEFIIFSWLNGNISATVWVPTLLHEYILGPF